MKSKNIRGLNKLTMYELLMICLTDGEGKWYKNPQFVPVHAHFYNRTLRILDVQAEVYIDCSFDKYNNITMKDTKIERKDNDDGVL